MFDRLVPITGPAKTLRGEIVRATGRLHHEFFNNGNLNAYDGDGGVTEMFDYFLTIIRANVPNARKSVYEIRTIISDGLYGHTYQFSVANKKSYNDLTEAVVEQIEREEVAA